MGNWTCWYMISSNDFGLLTEHHGTSLSTVVIAWNETLWILSCCVGKLHTSPKSLPTPKKGSLRMVCHHLFISSIFVVGRLKVARPPMIWRGGLGVFRPEDAFPAFWNIICCQLVDVYEKVVYIYHLNILFKLQTFPTAITEASTLFLCILHRQRFRSLGW